MYNLNLADVAKSVIKSVFSSNALFELFVMWHFPNIKSFNQFSTSHYHKDEGAFQLARFAQCVWSDYVNISSIWSPSGIYIDWRTPPKERADPPVWRDNSVTCQYHDCTSSLAVDSLWSNDYCGTGYGIALTSQISRGQWIIRHSVAANRFRGNALLLHHKYVTAKIW